MNHFWTILTAAIASSAFLLNGANAAERVAPIHDWTGYYAGVNGGYRWGKTTELGGSDNMISSFLEPLGARTLGGNPKGFVGGAQLGFNKQSGNLVYGLEIDLDGGDLSTSDSKSRVLGILRTASASQKLGWFGTLRGRLGYTPVDRLLIFATAGLAAGRAEVSGSMLSNNCIAGTCVSGSSSVTKTGWAIGGGLEYAVTKNWSAKLEYLYFDLGHAGFAQVGNSVINPLAGEAALRSSVARAGINYKFN